MNERDDLIDLTRLDRSELAHIWNAIAHQSRDDRFFTTKELDVLPDVLAPYEQVLGFSSGYLDGNSWLIVITDQRILFLDKGMFFGLKQVSIELSRVNSFETQSGLLFGEILIGANAGVYRIEQVFKKTVIPFTQTMREAHRAHIEGRQMKTPGSEDLLKARKEAQNTEEGEGEKEETPDHQPNGTENQADATIPITPTSPPLDIPIEGELARYLASIEPQAPIQARGRISPPQPSTSQSRPEGRPTVTATTPKTDRHEAIGEGKKPALIIWPAGMNADQAAGRIERLQRAGSIDDQAALDAQIAIARSRAVKGHCP